MPFGPDMVPPQPLLPGPGQSPGMPRFPVRTGPMGRMGGEPMPVEPGMRANPIAVNRPFAPAIAGSIPTGLEQLPTPRGV
jgi:hypothetical protein